MALSVSEEMTQQTDESPVRCRQKEASDDVDRTLGGKEFQARAAATENARSPSKATQAREFPGIVMY